VRCPKCGANNPFTSKRTGKAKLLGVATVGVGLGDAQKAEVQRLWNELEAGGGPAGKAHEFRWSELPAPERLVCGPDHPANVYGRPACG
jgi:hypothetical protein